MSLTTTGPSVSGTPIRKKRFEDINFNFTFAAATGVDWTGLRLQSQLRNDRDQLIWSSGEITGTVTSGVGTATITIPSATTGALAEAVYYIDFIYWSSTVGKTATPTYKLIISDGPTDL